MFILRKVFKPVNLRKFMEGLDMFGEVITKLQILMIISIPVFGLMFKEAFLFFMPLVIFILLSFGYIKKKILEDWNEEQITRLIFSIGKWVLFLWFLEFAMYMSIKYMISGTI